MEPKLSRTAASEAFREALRGERLRRRMSQSEAAAAAGLSRKWLSDFERGLADPPLGAALSLASALGATLSMALPGGEESQRVHPPAGSGDLLPLPPSEASARLYLRARRAVLGIPHEGELPPGLSDPAAFARFMHSCDREADRTLREGGSWLRTEAAALADAVAEAGDPRAWLAAELSGPARAAETLAAARIPVVSAAARAACAPARRPGAFNAAFSLETWMGKADRASGRSGSVPASGGAWTSVDGEAGREEARLATGRRFRADDAVWAWRAHGADRVVAAAAIRSGRLAEIAYSKRGVQDGTPAGLDALCAAVRSA